MLGHQLQALPPVEAFWNALPEFFAWLETGIAPVRPAAYRMAAEGEVLDLLGIWQEVHPLMYRI